MPIPSWIADVSCFLLLTGSGAARKVGQSSSHGASEIIDVHSLGDLEEPVLQSIIDKIRQESGFAADVPLDRLVDLTLLREVKA